jgi:hypothetical protein
MKHLTIPAVIVCLGCATSTERHTFEQKARKEIHEANVALLASKGQEMRHSYEETVAEFLGRIRDSIKNDADMSTLNKRLEMNRMGDGRWNFSDPIPSDQTIGEFFCVAGPVAADNPAKWNVVAFFSEDGLMLRSVFVNKVMDKQIEKLVDNSPIQIYGNPCPKPQAMTARER